MTGYIYFIETEDSKYVKIGFSQCVYRRLCQLGTLRPIGYGIRLIGYMAGARETEQRIHADFQSLRHHGEWFTSTPELRLYVNSLDLSTVAMNPRPPRPKADPPPKRIRRIPTSLHFSALGKLRAAKFTVEERQRYGKRGGRSRAEKLPPERRREIARNAARARWGKK